MKNEIAVKLVNIQKSYGPVNVLNNVNLEVKTKEVLVIIGPSGGGKSTLLRTVNLLGEPDSGEVFVDNINLIKNSRKIRELIGYVAQDIALDKILTGRELLDFQSDLYHMKKKEKYERGKKHIKYFMTKMK